MNKVARDRIVKMQGKIAVAKASAEVLSDKTLKYLYELSDEQINIVKSIDENLGNAMTDADKLFRA